MANIISEKFWPNDNDVAYIQECAADIEPDDQSLQQWFQNYSRNHRHRLALDLGLFKKYAKKQGRILEVGSAPLIFTTAVSKLGHQITGVDIDPSRFSKAISSLGLDVCKCDIEQSSLPLESNSFDVAVVNELFEHLRINLNFTFREIHRVLKPNGILLMSTPNLRSLSGLYHFLAENKAYSCSEGIYSQYEKLDRIGHMGHVREYTTSEVSEFLENLDFEVQELVFRGRYNTNWQQLLVRQFPRLRPFVTYVARAVKG